jgi:hypothetical protein
MVGRNANALWLWHMMPRNKQSQNSVALATATNATNGHKNRDVGPILRHCKQQQGIVFSSQESWPTNLQLTSCHRTGNSSKLTKPASLPPPANLMTKAKQCRTATNNVTNQQKNRVAAGPIQHLQRTRYCHQQPWVVTKQQLAANLMSPNRSQ